MKAKAAAGVGAVDAAGAVGDAVVGDGAAPPAPPVSIDGKGTLINTYA